MLATFAAGCFWGVEEAFLSSGKAIKTVVGYTGGLLRAPTYHQVCTGQSGHAESVQVQYDPQTTKYSDLLSIFWKCHDPTQLNRQGPDVGSQYKSAIFYHDNDQKLAAESSKNGLLARGLPVVTLIEAAKEFYPAEEYHQQYLRKNNRTCNL